MNGNSSKQVLLSVLGIAVLVVAVVGVSFAFFTYSRQGTTNNELTTGSIIFHYTEGTAIKLTNQFPVTDTAGKSITAGTGDNAVLAFAVSGHDTSGKGITYYIRAFKGTVPTSPAKLEANRFYDSEIKIMLSGPTVSGTPGALPSGTVAEGTFDTGSLVGTANNNDASTAGVLLATGHITSSSDVTHDYELRMWIPSQDTTVSSTTYKGVSLANETNRTNHAYSQDKFADMFYSLRIDVNAEANN